MKHSAGESTKIDENIAKKSLQFRFILNSREITRLGNQNKKLEFSTLTWKSKYISWIFKTIRNLGNCWLYEIPRSQESHFAPQFRKYRAEIISMGSIDIKKTKNYIMCFQFAIINLMYKHFK